MLIAAAAISNGGCVIRVEPSVLIMLPRSLGNADIFYLQLLHLASRARCIAIDYPGAQTAALADE